MDKCTHRDWLDNKTGEEISIGVDILISSLFEMKGVLLLIKVDNNIFI
jgi:hypothetical protein